MGNALWRDVGDSWHTVWSHRKFCAIVRPRDLSSSDSAGRGPAVFVKRIVILIWLSPVLDHVTNNPMGQGT